jgi:hypothetical protein
LALLIAWYLTSADVFRRTALVVLIAIGIAAAVADLSGGRNENRTATPAASAASW